MTIEEQKRLLRERQAGYEALRRFEIEQARKATVSDRLAAFCRLMEWDEYMPHSDGHTDDALFADVWRTVHERYDALH